MAQRRNIDVRSARLDDLGKPTVERRIFGLGRREGQLAVDRKLGAAFGKNHLAGGRLGDDIPALLAGLAPVEFGMDGKARSALEVQIGGDRRIAVFRKLQRRAGQEERRQDMGDDRQSVDAGIEDAEAAGLPDPFLVRMPMADIFLPDHMGAADGRAGKKSLGSFHRGRIARMPACKERNTLCLGEIFEISHFAQGRARRLFQEDVLAGRERLIGRFVAILRRHAERDGVDCSYGIEHGFDGRERRNAFDRTMAACRGDQLEIRIIRDRREMLITDDLADADDSELDGGHGCFSISMIIDLIFIRMAPMGKGGRSQMRPHVPPQIRLSSAPPSTAHLSGTKLLDKGTTVAVKMAMPRQCSRCV
ncbi:hypothetical protein RHSP_18447 [Rhizobium freirei PRF 81]|uniref:Uncharacterized protein n=1 Tax=Rhizobium freirei PRF 81 TaxID=363754 RepID=N6TZG8_9HYPH|nr:hypothetical protein RHSP_18447 [Rhizobium freirei PRF 81]